MPIVLYDPRDPQTNNDPLPVLKALQARDHVHWSDVLRGWVITRYDDVRRIQLGRDYSADRLTPFYGSLSGAEQSAIGTLMKYLNSWVAFKDPPDHGRLRTLMNQMFQVREIDELRPFVLGAVTQLLDRQEGKDEFDFVRDFAFPLPATVIMHMCGLPPADMEDMKTWSEMMKPFIGSATASPDKYSIAERGARHMADYFRDVVRARHSRPGCDIISRLLSTQSRGGGLTDDEVIGACMLFLFGGHETTTNLIANGMRLLMEFPEAHHRLRENSGLMSSALEEMLRFNGPTGALVRIVKTDHVLHERRLKCGDRVFLMINAANRDPRRFVDPDRFDIERSPNPHLTFNYGPHFCLGAPLARMEGQIAISEVIRRLPRLSLASDDVKYMDTLVMRGVLTMPVTVSQAG